MPDQFITTPNASFVQKVSNYVSNNRKKLTIAVFVAFVFAVAFQTLVSEINKDKPKTTEIIISPTPTVVNGNIPGLNSNVEVVDNTTNKYENTLVGFSFEYPNGVGLVREGGIGNHSASTIYILIDDLNSPYTPNVDQLKSDRLQLENGNFGLDLYPGKLYLKSVTKSGSNNIKIFTNFEKSECNAPVIEKIAQFYRFDRRITLILRGSVTRLIKENPNYFTQGSGNCESQKVWSSIGIESFLSSISRRSAPDYILKWNTDFSNLIATLRIVPPSDPDLFTGKVNGRWEGDNMVITFVANNKLGKVVEMKVWYTDKEEGNWEALAAFKRVPSRDKIRVRYKDQYGNVSRIFSTKVDFK